MAKRTQTVRTNKHLITIDFSRLVDALDTTSMLDTGQDKRSQKDASIRIVLGMIAQVFHNQTVGELPGGIPNTTKRVTDSKAQIDELMKGHTLENGEVDWDRLTSNPRWQNACFYDTINEERHDCYTDALASVAAVYSEIFGEAWKPYVRTDKSNAAPANAMSDELKAKAVALAKAKYSRAA